MWYVGLCVRGRALGRTLMGIHVPMCTRAGTGADLEGDWGYTSLRVRGRVLGRTLMGIGEKWAYVYEGRHWGGPWWGLGICGPVCTRVGTGTDLDGDAPLQLHLQHIALVRLETRRPLHNLQAAPAAAVWWVSVAICLLTHATRRVMIQQTTLERGSDRPYTSPSSHVEGILFYRFFVFQ